LDGWQSSTSTESELPLFKPDVDPMPPQMEPFDFAKTVTPLGQIGQDIPFTGMTFA